MMAKRSLSLFHTIVNCLLKRPDFTNHQMKWKIFAVVYSQIVHGTLFKCGLLY